MDPFMTRLRLRLRFYLLAALSLALPFNGRAQFDWIINADNTITIIRKYAIRNMLST